METLRALAHEPRQLIEPGIVLVVTFAIAYLVRSLILRGLRAWVARTGSRPGHILCTALSGPTTIWALILAVHLAIQSSPLPRHRHREVRSQNSGRAVDCQLHPDGDAHGG